MTKLVPKRRRTSHRAGSSILLLDGGSTEARRCSSLRPALSRAMPLCGRTLLPHVLNYDRLAVSVGVP